MKKLLVVAAVLPLLMSAALAGSVSNTIPVNATIDSACIFDGESTALSFHYDAVNGITQQEGGQSATLYCNFGTMIVDDRHGITIDTVEPVSPGGNTLRVAYDVQMQDAGGTSPGAQYYGADARYWTVTATAAAGQWQPDTGTKEGSVTINVSF
ncbi:hypothetical protein [Deinococcus sp. Leaf326]|uniref:hypothetical protein n=1 Tax=Deinococcus sp. Leaf326 TaxID=1736338 RepID=UPI0012E0D4F0|nr:hypothetical protein [Deinococcus sp. Leaf326]